MYVFKAENVRDAVKIAVGEIKSSNEHRDLFKNLLKHLLAGAPIEESELEKAETILLQLEAYRKAQKSIQIEYIKTEYFKTLRSVTSVNRNRPARHVHIPAEKAKQVMSA